MSEYGLHLNMDKTKIYPSWGCNEFEFAGIRMTAGSRTDQSNVVTGVLKQRCDLLNRLNIRKHSKLALYRKSLQHQLLFYQLVDKSPFTNWEKAD